MFRVIEVPCELSPFFSDPETRTARRTPPRRWKRNRFGFFFPLYRLHRRHTHTHTQKFNKTKQHLSLSLGTFYFCFLSERRFFLCVCVCVCVCMCTLSDVFFFYWMLIKTNRVVKRLSLRSFIFGGWCLLFPRAGDEQVVDGGGALLGF